MGDDPVMLWGSGGGGGGERGPYEFESNGPARGLLLSQRLPPSD